MAFRFIELVIYKEAKQLHIRVFAETECLSSKHRYLADQIRRASLSVPLNIAEGSGKTSSAEFARHITIALGSVNEVFAGLDIARDIKIIESNKIQQIENSAELLKNRLGAMRRKLKADR